MSNEQGQQQENRAEQNRAEIDEILARAAHIPGYASLRETPQDPRWHAEGDVATHTHMVLQQAQQLAGDLDESRRRILLHAAALHDLGKVTTTRQEEGHLVSPGHPQASVNMSAPWLASLLPGGEALQVLALIGAHHAGAHAAREALEGDGRRLRLLAQDLDMDLLSRLMLADARGRISPGGGQQEAEMMAEAALALAPDFSRPFPESPFSTWREALTDLSPEDQRRGWREYLEGEIFTPEEARARALWRQGTQRGSGRTGGHLHVMMGLPGGGKSSFTSGLLREQQARLIELDELRQTMQEGELMQEATRQLRHALASGERVIWDATNLRRDRRLRLSRLAHDYGATCSLHLIHCSPEQAGHNQRARARQIPEGVIARMNQGLQWPGRQEGWDLIEVQLQLPGERFSHELGGGEAASMGTVKRGRR